MAPAPQTPSTASLPILSEHKPLSTSASTSRNSLLVSADPITTLPPRNRSSKRWQNLKRQSSLLRFKKHDGQHNWDLSETPNSVSKPASNLPRTNKHTTSAPAIKISRPASPFQHKFYNTSTSSISSAASIGSNSDDTFVNNATIVVNQPTPSQPPVSGTNSAPVAPFSLYNIDSSLTKSTGPSFAQKSRPTAPNPYSRHALFNPNQVPMHPMSSARISRHFKSVNGDSSNAPCEAVESAAAEQQVDLTSSLSNDDHPPINRQDSLTVDVMKLPQSFNKHNTSHPTMVAPPPPSMRSSVMNVIPPMQNVWLEDDDDDDRGVAKDLFKKNMNRLKHISTTSVNRYSGSESSYDLARSSSNSKNRNINRRSFGYGRESEIQSGHSMMEKLKKSFSPKGPTGTESDLVIGTPILLINSHSGMSSRGVDSNFIRPYTTPIAEAPPIAASIKNTPTGKTYSSPSAGNPNRLSTASKLSRSLSTRSSLRTLPNSPKSPKPSVRGQSTASKLLNLLTSKSHKQGKAAADLNKPIISGPVNFTHTAHAGAPLSAVPSLTTNRVSRFQPSRPDRPIGIEIPSELGVNAPALSSSSASSLQRSSYIGSPNTLNMAVDNISISTASVDEYSPTRVKKHRLFFSRLNAHGSRTSFHGVDSSDDGRLSNRQSIDSLRSDRNNIYPTASPARYSLPASSLRARSRLSVNSTISIDSVTSNSLSTGYNYPLEDQQHRSLLLPSPLMSSDPTLLQVSPQPIARHLRQEYPAPAGTRVSLDRVREEGWF